MSTDRPLPHLLDLLRGRDGDNLGPLTLRIVEAALDDDFTPVDLQAAAISAAANLVVQLTRPERLRRRSREAEQLFRKFLRAHERRHAELDYDLKADHREMSVDLQRAFGDAFREVAASRPIPQRFIDAGAGDPEHYRKVLLAADLQHRLLEAFVAAGLDHSADRVTMSLAACVAAAAVCAAPYDIAGEDDAGFAELFVDEFRTMLINTIAYWRKKGAS